MIYASGAAIKIDETDPAMIPTPITTANDCITDCPNTYIAATDKSVETPVPSDLLIVCRTLFSKTDLYVIDPPIMASVYVMLFSLILSKTTIVSLILYHIVVKIAITKIVSTVIVGLIDIHKA